MISFKNKFIFYFLDFTSRFTKWFPKKGAKIINKTISVLVGNNWLARSFFLKNLKILKKIKHFNKICVLGDINIGDALFTQATVSGLRDFFPDNQIDCVVNHNAFKLLNGNPGVSNLHPVYSGSIPSTGGDLSDLKDILMREKYDLIISMSPFFSEKQGIFPKNHKMIDLSGLVARIIQGEKDKTSIIHVIYQSHKFIYDLFSQILTPKLQSNFSGANITLSREAITAAQNFLEKNKLVLNKPKVFLNPDTASRFTRIPVKIQVSILEKLAGIPCDVLLGAGHIAKGIENEILNALPIEKRNRIKIVPASVAIDVYAALIDYCDIFVTGDTGPMHIAAARKLSQSGDFKFRNRTAVFSIFGAGSSRIHGYDSCSLGHYPANQNAPAHAYNASNSCRNFTCCVYSETGKTCKKILCFDNLDIDKIIFDIKSILSRN